MRKLLAFDLCLLGLAGVASAQTPPGAALSPGYLSVQGNQFVDSSGNKMRIASTSYRGTPTDQATMNAIRQAGFNAVRIDWRDAYLSGASGESPPGTTVTTVGPSINASPTPGSAGSGNIITITSGGQIAVNTGSGPVTISNTANVIKLYYNADTAYQENNANNWFGPIVAGNGGSQLADPTTAALSGFTIPAGCNTLAQMDQCVALAAAATPQPLKVIFSHRGNEIPSSPSNACNARQANGLWFDSGGSSGNDDGCGDGGNVTYATFKANTASLMQRYAGNSTVIGYDFHAEPLVNGAFTGTGGGGATGQFSVNSSGQIIDPNGNVWIARGYSVTLGDAQAGTSGPVRLSELQRLYPRTNYIRIWGDYTQWTPSAQNTWITSLTNVGIAVGIEDYTGNGECRSGGDLAAANAWYQAAASFYKSNPGVIFETQNECYDLGGNPAEPQNEIQTNYNAIRAGGYTGLVFIGSAGGAPDPGNGQWYFSNTLFAPMTNIGFDIHPYPDAYNSFGVAASQSAFNAQLQSWVQSYSQWHTNTEPSVPVISGEIGNCGNTNNQTGCNSNNTPITNWQLAVHAAAQVAAVTGNNSTGVSAGVGYWQWGDDGDDSNVDTMVIGGNATNPYGVQVQGDIAGMAGAGPTPFTGGGGGGTGANPPVNWGGGGDTDILAACNDVGAAVFAVNPGIIQFCEGPLNNGANNLLSGAAKP